jgi:hypothetical protein
MSTIGLSSHLAGRFTDEEILEMLQPGTRWADEFNRLWMVLRVNGQVQDDVSIKPVSVTFVNMSTEALETADIEHVYKKVRQFKLQRFRFDVRVVIEKK